MPADIHEGIVVPLWYDLSQNDRHNMNYVIVAQ